MVGVVCVGALPTFLPLIPSSLLYIQRRLFRVRLDERFSRRNVRSHQHVKYHICLLRIFDGDQFQNPASGIHRRLPQLIRIHLTQSFISLHRYLCFSFCSCLDVFRLLLTVYCFLFTVVHFFQRNILTDEFYFLILRIGIRNLFPFFYLIQRRLGYIEIPVVYDRPEMPIKERKKKRAYVRSVHVGVCSDYYLMVAELLYIEHISNRGPQCDNKISYLLRGKHFIYPSALNVQNFAAERQNRLYASIAPHFTCPACRIAFHNE